MNNERKIAYFSMEVGLETDMPTYSGGLGVTQFARPPNSTFQWQQ